MTNTTEHDMMCSCSECMFIKGGADEISKGRYGMSNDTTSDGVEQILRSEFYVNEHDECDDSCSKKWHSDQAFTRATEAIEAHYARELVEAKIAVTSNAKIYTNKHDASYIVFEAEHRDVSQNELTAIYYSELSNLDRINTTIKIPQELTKPESKENL